MAAPRISFKQKLFTQMKNNSTLTGLLGPITSDNFRIYSAYPQQQPKLSGTESDEGWLVFFELGTAIPFPHSLYEDFLFQFDIYGVRQTLGDEVVDTLDTMWHRAADQDGYTIDAERNVLFSQRVLSQDVYAEDARLFQKLVNYRYRVITNPWRAGA